MGLNETYSLISAEWKQAKKEKNCNDLFNAMALRYSNFSNKLKSVHNFLLADWLEYTELAVYWNIENPTDTEKDQHTHKHNGFFATTDREETRNP